MLVRVGPGRNGPQAVRGRVPEFAHAVDAFGIPEDQLGDYAGQHFRCFELYEEAQVWSDAVVDHHV